MITPNVHPSAEQLHPSLWRASQLAHAVGHSIDTGHLALSNQLPDNGWPTGVLVELLIQQPGSGELKLLAPAMRKVQEKKLVFLQPPHTPNALSLAALGMAPEHLIWLKSKTTADALWAAEQVLRSGSCGTLLFWNNHVRPESLRRLHLTAQAGQTLFCILRPLAVSQDASPAPLRLSVRPAAGGINIGFVKRRGPQRDDPLFLPFGDSLNKTTGHEIAKTRPMPIAVPSSRIITSDRKLEVY